MAIRLLPRRLLGQTIRGIRNRLGMSQADFARSLGLESAAVVGRWEKGQAQPEYGTLAKIATMGLVDVLVFHEPSMGAEMPQLTPGEASELREILTRMEALLADARVLVDRAVNRTAVEILDAVASSPPQPAELDALVLDAELRVETREKPRAQGRSRTASAGRRSTARSATPSRSGSRGGGRSRGSATAASEGGSETSSTRAGTGTRRRGSSATAPATPEATAV